MRSRCVVHQSTVPGYGGWYRKGIDWKRNLQDIIPSTIVAAKESPTGDNTSGYVFGDTTWRPILFVLRSEDMSRGKPCACR